MFHTVYCLQRVTTQEEIGMDDVAAWTEQLQEAEGHLEAAHTVLSELHRELKDAGRKKDMLAITEVVDRLARYGRLFEDMRLSWTEPTD